MKGRIGQLRLELAERAQDQQAGLGCEACGQGVGVEAAVHERNRDQLGARQLQHVQYRREPRVLHEHAVAVADDGADDAVQGVYGAVHDGQGLGLEGPALVQYLGQCRQHRLVQVAGDRWLVVERCEGRTQWWQEGGIGCARAEVQPVGVAMDRHLPEAPRFVGPAPCPHEAAAPAGGVEEPGVLEPSPGVGDDRRADVEAAGQGANRGQAVTALEGAVVDQAADGRGDSGCAAIRTGGVGDRLDVVHGHRVEPSSGRIGNILFETKLVLSAQP